jgi:hypothetical protein
MGFILAVTDSRQGSEGPAIAISVRRAQAAMERRLARRLGLISRDLISAARFTSSRTGEKMSTRAVSLRATRAAQ